MAATAGEQAARKAKTAKGKRALEKKAPKEVEDGKRILLLQGNKTSQTGKDVLADLFKLKKGEAAKLSRKNDIWPFEPGNEVSLQFFCERADCALFCLANHNKKRPHNLVLGRMFNAQLLDMLELGVTQHVPIATFAGAAHVQAGAKPCFLFVGDAFERDERHKLAKSLLIDVFRGQEVSEMTLMSLSHVIVCTATGQADLKLRHYAVLLKKSGTRIPRVELQEAGPLLDLTIRRMRPAPADLMREALTKPSSGKKKIKNTGHDELAGSVGRIYMPAQDLTDVALAKGKGVKRARREAAADRKEQRRDKVAAGGAASLAAREASPDVASEDE